MKRSALLIAVLLSTNVQAQSLRDVIGVAHLDGKYSLSTGSVDYLAEGASRIYRELGSRVIKIRLTTQPSHYYPFHSPMWQTNSEKPTLAEAAAHPYYRQVFAMPFTTFILTVDDSVWFQDGMTVSEERTEERTFYEVTRYLMSAYAGSGKTFILQNWEGDWLLRMDAEGGLLPDSVDPEPVAVSGMIRWIQARQRGVERARAELADQVEPVFVRHAVEVNHLRRSKFEPERISVADDVLPFAEADLYSYSAWESVLDDRGDLLREMLTFLDERTAGQSNVYVGEYGLPENMFGTAEHLNRVVDLTEAALAWGARYIVYWQIFCNEFAAEAPREGTPLNVDMRGYWLIRPDGTYSPVWSYLRSKVAFRPTRHRGLLQVKTRP